MKRLNPKDEIDDKVLMGIFSPNNSYYMDLQNECFESFLMSDGTTKEGQKMIAEYYQVQDLWKDMATPDCDFERYLNLLLLVKTKSQVDYLWVSFVEGLHWHAAMITCLLCTKIDCFSNKIQPGSPDIQHFENARVPHFKDPGATSKEQLKLVISGEFEAKMLKSTFNVQAYIPNQLTGNIDELTKAMKNQSNWISINKTQAANKTISKVISLWLKETLLHSSPRRKNNDNLQPKLISYFTYQTPDSTEKITETKNKGLGSDKIYGY
jgi:hypothetical protein